MGRSAFRASTSSGARSPPPSPAATARAFWRLLRAVQTVQGQFGFLWALEPVGTEAGLSVIGGMVLGP